MKTIFIINPKAGTGKNLDKRKDEITKMAAELGVEVGFYITKAVGDAEKFARLVCEETKATNPDEELRLVACGGDGTVNEVLNGIMGYENAVLGVVPIGTGNDFVRNFPENADFLDISAQLQGYTMKSDVIKYSGVIDGKEQTRYCINMFNIGFDCNVADTVADMKTKPLVSGSMAYFLSILVTLIKKKCSDLKIELDGKEVHNGKTLLSSVANGCYCGGGIKSNSLASVSDGLININIIKNVSRARFITLLPSYMKGTVLQNRMAKGFVVSPKCKKIVITPNNTDIRISVDGEIISAGKTDFEIVHNAFNFVLPQ